MEQHSDGVLANVPDITYDITTISHHNWKNVVTTTGVKIKVKDFDSSQMNLAQFSKATEDVIRRGLKDTLDLPIEGSQEPGEPFRLQITLCNDNLHTRHRSTHMFHPSHVDAMIEEAVHCLANAQQSEKLKADQGLAADEILYLRDQTVPGYSYQCFVPFFVIFHPRHYVLNIVVYMHVYCVHLYT